MLSRLYATLIWVQSYGVFSIPPNFSWIIFRNSSTLPFFVCKFSSLYLPSLILRFKHTFGILKQYAWVCEGYAYTMSRVCQGYAKGMPVHPLLNDSTFFKFPETAFRCLNVTHCIMGIIEILVEKFPIKLLELGIFVTIDATYPTEIR